MMAVHFVTTVEIFADTYVHLVTEPEIE